MSKWSKKPAKPEKNSGVVLAEPALAAMIVLEPTTLRFCDGLEPEHFSCAYASAIFVIARDLVARGVEASAALIQVEMERRLHISDAEVQEYFADLAEINWGVPTEPTVKEMVKTIRNKATDRAVVAAGETLVEAARNDGVTTDAKIAQADAVLQKVKQLKEGDRPLVSGPELVQRAMQRSAEVAERGTMPGLSTGFAELDEMLGGLSPAELIILAARPSMGKTALALSFAYSAAAKQHRPVLMVSLEMDADQVGLRWVSMISNVPAGDIKWGRVTPSQHDAIERAHQAHMDVPILIEETPGLPFSKIANRARMLHAKLESGLGMLVVDYLQLIDTDEMPGDNRTEQIGAISVGLKRLSRELRIPVVALAQLNRSLEKRQDKRPIMSDVRDSGNIEQDADVILFLYRDEVYHPDSPDVGRGEIIIAKQRNGRLGTVMVDFDGEHTMFRDSRKAGIEVPMRKYGS